MDTTAIKSLITRAESLILCIRASGGYKYRAHIPRTDAEVERLFHEAANIARYNMVALAVAEEMLGDAAQMKDRREEHKQRTAEAWAAVVAESNKAPGSTL